MLNKLVLVVCALAVIPHFVNAYKVYVEKRTNGFIISPVDARSTNILSPRIIGGEEVTPHQYPFQACLLIYKGTDTYFCGGTLITNQWVLTAAHCLEMKPDNIYVVLGAHNLFDLNITTVQAYSTTLYKYHKEWNGNTYQNDVGLVRLPFNATINDYVNVVDLATGTDKYEGNQSITLGWGRTEADELSTVLKRVTSTVMTNEDCANANINYVNIIKSMHICISGEGPKGSCNGDSGGPLLVDDVQVGVVSFGTTNCSLGMPSVFARVTDFNDWINENLVDEGFDDGEDNNGGDDNGGDDNGGDDNGGDDNGGDDGNGGNDGGGANTYSLHVVAFVSAALLCFVRFFGLM